MAESNFKEGQTKDHVAMVAEDLLLNLNVDEGALTGTSVTSSSTSTAVSSSSSISSSSVSTGGIKTQAAGWKGMNLCRRPSWQQQMIEHPMVVTSPRRGYTRPSSLAGSARHRFAMEMPPTSTNIDVELSTTSKIFKAFRISKKRLSFEPSAKLYFPYEPGKQSTSAVRIKNISQSPVAFKFQTTSPKSCFMRPPNGVLTPGESIVAIVVKFIELPKALEQQTNVPLKRKTRDKFKIVSLKIHEGIEFIPELFDEHKELAAVEQVLQVVLLDPKQPSSQLEKLKTLLAEADAAEAVQAKSQVANRSTTSNINDLSVLEEWKQRKLARQQGK